VYIVGLFLGNTAAPMRQTRIHFHEGLAYLSQVVLFIVLGLLVFPSELAPIAWSALGLTAILVLLARPLAVVVSITPFRYSWREQVFVSWAGLRGAVPIVLATFALSAGVAGSDTIFNAVFFVVLVSALLQTVTLDPLARWLGVAAEARPSFHPPVELGVVQALGGDILEYDVEQSDAVVGTRVAGLRLPESALVMLIVRDDQAIPPRGSTIVETGDRLYVLARSEVRPDVEAVIEEWQRRGLPRDARRRRGRPEVGPGEAM
jgi:cell volume regulation protein A